MKTLNHIPDTSLLAEINRLEQRAALLRKLCLARVAANKVYHFNENLVKESVVVLNAEVVIETVVAAVSAVFKISRADLFSHRRLEFVVRARFAAFYVIRELSVPNRISSLVITRYFGKKDHGTVLSGLASCRNWMETEGIYRHQVEQALADSRGRLFLAQN